MDSAWQVAVTGWAITVLGWLLAPIVRLLLNKILSYLGFDASQTLLCCLGQRMRSTPRRSDGDEQLPISRAPSVSLVETQRLRCWSRPFDFINCCRSICYLLANAYEVACSYRNCFYDMVGITSYQVLQIERQTAAGNSRVLVSTAAPPTKVFGRDEDRHKIIAMLHEAEGDGQPTSNSDLCYSIIGIHDISGSGKSTLAQLVYDHEKKRDHFNLVLWVYVSQNFSVDTIFSEMFEAVTGNSCSELNNLNALQEKLEEKLCGKRFLLVLDDVWYSKDVSHQQKLKQILSPLRVGGAGSKILVTSRTEDALRVLGAVRRIPISDLDEKDFLNLFMHYALEDSMIDDQDRRKFDTIGEDIAKKLKRSPLAARTVGGQLRKKQDVDYWKRVREVSIAGALSSVYRLKKEGI